MDIKKSNKKIFNQQENEYCVRQEIFSIICNIISFISMSRYSPSNNSSYVTQTGVVRKPQTFTFAYKFLDPRHFLLWFNIQKDIQIRLSKSTLMLEF